MSTQNRTLISLGPLLLFLVAAAPTSAPSDAQMIRQAAYDCFIPITDVDSKTLDCVWIRSDLERRFAEEMIKAMRAERHMHLRAAIATTGSEESFAVRMVKQSVEDNKKAVLEGTPAIDGDRAAMKFAPGGGDGTTLHFVRENSGWKFDLLYRYRERQQIDEDGIKIWIIHQRAAENVANKYEHKELRNFLSLERAFEQEKHRLLAEHAVARAATQP